VFGVNQNIFFIFLFSPHSERCVEMNFAASLRKAKRQHKAGVFTSSE
jgi:hypothetical protein